MQRGKKNTYLYKEDVSKGFLVHPLLYFPTRVCPQSRSRWTIWIPQLKLSPPSCEQFRWKYICDNQEHASNHSVFTKYTLPQWDKCKFPPGKTNMSWDKCKFPPGKINMSWDKCKFPPGKINMSWDKCKFPPGKINMSWDKCKFPPGN